MAVYTHFGGMPGLIEAIASETFARFTRALTEVAQTDDPVADFFVMGVRYREFALANPQRYQMMFGTSAVTEPLSRRPHRHRQRQRQCRIRGVVRGAADRGAPDDRGGPHPRRRGIGCRGAAVERHPREVLLEIAGFFGHEDRGITEVLAPLTIDVLVGMGDDRERVLESFASAVARIGY